jgi:hypothetical protein
MKRTLSLILLQILTLAAGVLILKVSLSVVLGYRDYFPANFSSDFLRGRQSYFSGAYQWAFYTHILSGPVSLVLGLMLVSERFRLRFPKWHRSLGKTQGMLVLFLVAPSGFWMAQYAQTGTVAAIGFSMLAIATGMCVAFGWRCAVKRSFAEHRRWMWRCFLLLCSAVVIRVIGGAATVAETSATWIYPVSAYVSWLVPLAVFELRGFVKRHRARPQAPGRHPHSAPSATFQSPPSIEISARRTSGVVVSMRN